MAAVVLPQSLSSLKQRTVSLEGLFSISKLQELEELLISIIAHLGDHETTLGQLRSDGDALGMQWNKSLQTQEVEIAKIAELVKMQKTEEKAALAEKLQADVSQLGEALKADMAVQQSCLQELRAEMLKAQDANAQCQISQSVDVLQVEINALKDSVADMPAMWAHDIVAALKPVGYARAASETCKTEMDAVEPAQPVQPLRIEVHQSAVGQAGGSAVPMKLSNSLNGDVGDCQTGRASAATLGCADGRSRDGDSDQHKANRGTTVVESARALQNDGDPQQCCDGGNLERLSYSMAGVQTSRAPQYGEVHKERSTAAVVDPCPSLQGDGDQINAAPRSVNDGDFARSRAGGEFRKSVGFANSIRSDDGFRKSRGDFAKRSQSRWLVDDGEVSREFIVADGKVRSSGGFGPSINWSSEPEAMGARHVDGRVAATENALRKLEAQFAALLQLRPQVPETVAYDTESLECTNIAVRNIEAIVQEELRPHCQALQESNERCADAVEWQAQQLQELIRFKAQISFESRGAAASSSKCLTCGTSRKPEPNKTSIGDDRQVYHGTAMPGVSPASRQYLAEHGQQRRATSVPRSLTPDEQSLQHRLQEQLQQNAAQHASAEHGGNIATECVNVVTSPTSAGARPFIKKRSQYLSGGGATLQLSGSASMPGLHQVSGGSW